MISISDIESAYKTLKPVVHKTPLLSSRTFNHLNGNEVYFKAENFQRIGAFKFRGAYNKLSSLTEAERKRGVIAHSSGNHAQGVALASKLFGIKAVIVMPHDSVKSKVEATKGYGAEVIFCGTTTDDRERTTDDLIDKFGYTLIHPYNDEKLIAGQGTVALEIFQDTKDLDYLFVPIGGGGLISGCALAAKNLFPNAKVIGVETEGANDCFQSFRAKKIIKLQSVNTIADGMRTLSVGMLNFEIIQKYVDNIITIKDDDIYPMMKFFLERMKILVEPTGAVAPAAVMKNALDIRGKKVCAIISGGNVDPDFLKNIL
ncbi:MAG: threonine ammonia-lyase [Ignavibacteria bacterium]|nr:threonine ammonia-lyase [Ignavibacteria bacterium]MBI3765675.1 threonine ammonia-lyase [Ignavibacteriales bacterium]